MPRYFFNVHDGREIKDTEGEMLADDDAAREEAIRASGDLLRGPPSREVWNGEHWSMEVADEAGRVVGTLRFSGTVPAK